MQRKQMRLKQLATNDKASSQRQDTSKNPGPTWQSLEAKAETHGGIKYVMITLNYNPTTLMQTCKKNEGNRKTPQNNEVIIIQGNFYECMLNIVEKEFKKNIIFTL